jgi:S1-C subfamily serine protease
MKRFALIAVLIVAMALPALAADSQEVKASVAKSHKALCVVRCQITPQAGGGVIAGLGVCIDKSGLIMTTALNPRMRVESIVKLDLFLPGNTKTTVSANLIGIDPLSGLAFVQAKTPHDWDVVQFHAKSNLTVGDEVISVGLAIDDPALPVTAGLAYVASIRYQPAKQIYVTGGTLSGPGSVVFDASGRAIGLVTNQPFVPYQAIIQQRQINLPMRNDQAGLRFLPVEEFVSTLQNIPRGGKVRRLPWVGVGRFSPVPEELAEAKNVGDRPAVMIDQVITGEIGDKAGLKDRDIIVAFNGKPLTPFASPQLVSASFARELLSLPIGQAVSFGVLRGGKIETVQVTLAPMPTLPTEAKRIVQQKLGLLAREQVMLDKMTADSAAPLADGLIVQAVQPNSPAQVAGLMPDDVILAINNRAVQTVAQAKQLFDTALSANPPQPIRIAVQRGENTETLTIQPAR